jgi:RNA polymerase sigma factor (sigma-70 family)
VDQPDLVAELARRAVEGDSAALEQLCVELQDPLYRLALRMFSDRHDAADATQEALIRIVTHLDSFKGESQLTTWAYTVASRQFMRMSATRTESSVAGPVEFANWIDTHHAEPSAEAASNLEFDELAGEVRIACTYGMLLCLSRASRLVYLLGDVIGLTDTEGAVACEISPVAFRQRLSRARQTMRGVMAGRCGLVSSDNPCRCSHVVEASVEAGILHPNERAFTRHPGNVGVIAHGVIEAAASELDLAEAIGEVFRSDPAWSAPGRVMVTIRNALPTLLET